MLKNNYAYLSKSDIEEIYVKIKGSRKGITGFLRDSKKIASKTRNGALVYKDEEALYNVFEKYLENELKAYGINNFGRLMQHIS